MNESHETISNLLHFIDAGILTGVFLLLWVGHHLPWHIIPAITDVTGKRELRRVPAYVYGVGCIWLGAAAYVCSRSLAGLPNDIPLNALTTIIITAAGGTILPRLLTAIIDFIAKYKVDHDKQRSKGI